MTGNVLEVISGLLALMGDWKHISKDVILIGN